jgi:predicted AAA+ superfamily ATPase
MEVLKNSYIIDEINNFSFSLKVGARQKNKNYCIDNGLIEAVSFKFSENKGRLLENLVFTEYRKAGYQEVYFYNQKNECDFIFKKNDKFTALQVTYELNNENREREINALKEVKTKFGITDLKIITYNTFEDIEGISVEQIWKMALEL